MFRNSARGWWFLSFKKISIMARSSKNRDRIFPKLRQFDEDWAHAILTADMTRFKTFDLSNGFPTVDERCTTVQLMVLNHRHFLRPLIRQHYFSTLSSNTLRIFPLMIVFLNSIFNSFKNIFSSCRAVNAMNVKKFFTHFIIFTDFWNKK